MTSQPDAGPAPGAGSAAVALAVGAEALKVAGRLLHDFNTEYDEPTPGAAALAARLEQVVADLGLDRVRVLRCRAEELHGVERFDVVTARALAPLTRLLGWAMPLVNPSGELVAMKGSSAADEVAEAAPTLKKLHCTAPVIEELVAADGESTATVVRVAHARGARIR